MHAQAHSTCLQPALLRQRRPHALLRRQASEGQEPSYPNCSTQPAGQHGQGCSHQPSTLSCQPAQQACVGPAPQKAGSCPARHAPRCVCPHVPMAGQLPARTPQPPVPRPPLPKLSLLLCRRAAYACMGQTPGPDPLGQPPRKNPALAPPPPPPAAARTCDAAHLDHCLFKSHAWVCQFVWVRPAHLQPAVDAPISSLRDAT